MSRSTVGRPILNSDSRIVEVKSKLDAEYRRFMLNGERSMTFDEFHQLLKDLHRLRDLPFTIWFTDNEGDLLPINNDDNFARAVKTAKRLLRLTLLKSGDTLQVLSQKKSTAVSGILSSTGLYGTRSRRSNHTDAPTIGFPVDFRRVSAIIDIDIVPETCRRVKLMKNGVADKPLGFYIRDGASIRVTPQGLERVNGFFISRLAPGGLAESTGLLAINDEILEVNGIEVFGKTLDQVTDMMVANSNNLIITVKPVNQHNNVVPRRVMGSSRPDLSRLPFQRSQDGESLTSGPWDAPQMKGSSEGRMTPKVSAKILPSGVQVLEL